MTKQLKPALFVLVALFLIATNNKSFCAKTEKIQSLDTTSGWIAKDGFWEQKLKVGEITFLQYSKDGEHFYTFGTDNTFRTWENESGILIDEFKIPFSCYSPALSPNEETLAVSVDNNDYKSRNIDSVIMFSIIQKQKIVSINPLSFFDKNDCPFGISYTYIISKFNSDSTIVLSTNFDCSWGSSTTWDGIISEWKINGELSKKVQSNGQIFSISQSNDNENFAVAEYYRRTSSMGMGDHYYSENSSLTLFNSKFEKIKIIYKVSNQGYDTEYEQYKPLEHIMKLSYISHNSKYFVGFRYDNLMFFWNTDNGILEKVIPHGFLDHNYLPNDMTFSLDKRLSITASNFDENSCIIRFFNLASWTKCDSLMLNLKRINKLAISPDSVSILTGNGDGSIYLIRPYVMSKDIDFFDGNRLKSVVYPNPNSGEGSIRFNNDKSGYYNAKIYNCLGSNIIDLPIEKLEQGETEINFDLNLIPGIYFYTISLNNTFLSSGKLIILE